MDDRFSLGAHLLLWVFPALLVAAAVALHILTGGTETPEDDG